MTNKELLENYTDNKIRLSFLSKAIDGELYEMVEKRINELEKEILERMGNNEENE